MKTPVLESFLNKVAGLRPATLLKRDSNAGVFLWILRNIKNIYFEEHVQTAAESFRLNSFETSKGHLTQTFTNHKRNSEITTKQV